MANYERYQSLVKEAWQHYCQGDDTQMARSLQHSLEYTPYLRAKTISDWVNKFTQLSHTDQKKFDALNLIDLPKWNQLAELAMKQDNLPDFQITYSPTNPAALVNQLITEIPTKINYSNLHKFLSSIIQKHGIRTCELVAEHIDIKNLIDKSTLNRCLYFLTKETHLHLAVNYGYRFFELNPNDQKFAHGLLSKLYRIGDLEKAVTVAKHLNLYTIPVLKNDDKSFNQIIERFYLCFFHQSVDLYRSSIDCEVIKEFIIQNLWIKKQLFDQIKQYKNNHQIINEIEKIFELTQDVFFAQKLAYLYRSIGCLKASLKMFNFVENQTKIKDNVAELVKGEIQILEEGFKGININSCLENYSLDNDKKLNVLYVIHNSLPYKSVGYAIRSHYITQSLVKQQVKVTAVTRLGFPNDEIDIEQFPLCDQVDKVIYHRLKSSEFLYNKIPLPEYLYKYTESLLDFAYKHKPTILHSASNFINGIAANHVAKILGIPSIYEIRGLWEITRTSKEPDFENSDSFNMIKRMEVEAAMTATVVITLTEALKTEMVERGISRDKITVISNGADSQRFKPLERDRDLEAFFEYQNKVVIGYIGSVLQYEGIEYILQASAILKAKGFKNFAVLIVGDGDYLETVKLLCNQLNLQDIVNFTGRVSHQEVERYYSLVDITAYPRKGELVCEMVSPLKPFEAMSMEKCVVSSDVAALKEIVNDGVTGLLHKKDDVEDLARIFEILIENDSLRLQLGKAARNWIKSEKDWEIIGKKFLEIYQSLSN